MSETLRDLVAARLAGSMLDPAVQRILLEALGEDETGLGRPIRRAYLRSVTVSGFRGIGRTARLPLVPRPGLTLVVGRNGSGKSSFAEAVEIALTGDNARWSSRSDIWRRSWRNLHESATPQVAVELLIEGDTEPSTVIREWTGDDVGESRAEVERPGGDPVPLAELGWGPDLALYRPFLSYSELGQMISGRPSEMYDAVATILGLELLATADKYLRDRASGLEKVIKQAEAELPGLADTGDPRAQAAEAVLQSRKPDLDRLAELVAGDHTADDAEMVRLRRQAELSGPDVAAVEERVVRLRAALAAAEQVRGTSAEDARQRAELLERALTHFCGQACPVCGGAQLDDIWAGQARDEVARLRGEAVAADDARRELRVATQAVQELVENPPAGVPPEVGAAWTACRTLADPVVLAQEAPRAATALAAACRDAQEQAVKRLADLDGRWKETAAALAAWLVTARRAEAARPELKQVKAARKWLRDVHDELRAERMAPLGESSQMIWELLRQQSNVTLGPIQLAGSATQRRVVMDVSVDDIEAPALGVMSQGELQALALALFLPRAASRQSPFSFLVIDDPVQSMDPAKVDGLARVLAMIGETRQVVVFTHDTRLPQALKYLRLPATIIEVVRRERSVVELKESDDPVARALRDARALAKSGRVPDDVVRQVLPGLCRTALEAAFLEVAWHRLLTAGQDHGLVERQIGDAHKLTELAALALYGDASKWSQVLGELNLRYGHWAGDLVVLCNKAAHQAVPIGDVDELVGQTARLAKLVRSS
ncbi:AAA family ATPase [Microbispora sp. ATCC PTA-5024]|uniref:AAA family ATPase n=1 Tax=Microbispora sp. ATCC PTA-5024 TaxID=316330 RepID=UPI0003DC6081|nr:AAA family ATPase [Microbispora sp. ATCC PTA-5024]ETK36563.1 recombinase RecF [Microbispora sp. ATCC PTA-5024]